MLQYQPDIKRETITGEIFMAVHEAQVIETIPTIFFFEECSESKMFNFMYPSKLSDTIYMNLGTFAQREWNAVVTFSNGFTFVFFGKNDKSLEMPEVFNQAIVGSC